MSNTSTDAPRRQPSRRTVLKTGVHAAWAVPAIQIAAAAPAFAAVSDTAVLGVTTAGTAPASQSGATLTLPKVTIASSVADASVATLRTSGGATAADVSFGPVSVANSVSKTGLTVTLNEAGDGVVHLSAVGTTAGNGKAATQGTAATVYGASVLSIKGASHTKNNNNNGSIKVVVHASYATATNVKITIKNFTKSGNGNVSGNLTSGAVTVPSGTDYTVTFNNVSFGSGNGTRTIPVTIETGATTANAGNAPAIRPAAWTYTAPAGTGTFPTAALTITNEVDSRVFDWGTFMYGPTVTMRFRINSSYPVTGVKWRVTSTDGSTVYKDWVETVVASDTGYVDVPDFTFTSPVTGRWWSPSYTQVRITAVGTTVGSNATATGGTLNVSTDPNA